MEPASSRCCMITINVTGHGNFVIHSDKLDELLLWLRNNSMSVESNTRPLRDDQTLLNEKNEC